MDLYTAAERLTMQADAVPRFFDDTINDALSAEKDPAQNLRALRPHHSILTIRSRCSWRGSLNARYESAELSIHSVTQVMGRHFFMLVVVL